MSQFARSPVRVMDKAETLKMIQSRDWMTGIDRYRVKSAWLCERLNEFEKDGFVYNAEAQRRIEKDEGLEASPESGSPISVLIYNAQAYRMHDKLVAEGYVPFTAEVIAQAFNENKELEFIGSNLLGGEVRARAKARKVGDQLLAMYPKKRKYHIRPEGQPVKLI